LDAAGRETEKTTVGLTFERGDADAFETIFFY
jgi:hypothetical protein